MRMPSVNNDIPLSWLLQARSCTRSAIVVGIALWWCRDQAKSSRFRVTVARLAKVAETSTRTVQRALKELTDLGLISVERPAGWELIVTLQDGVVEVGR